MKLVAAIIDVLEAEVGAVLLLDDDATISSLPKAMPALKFRLPLALLLLLTGAGMS